MLKIIAFLLLFPFAAFAGNPGVIVSGSVTPNDCVQFLNGYTIEDSGSTCGGSGSVSITANSSNIVVNPSPLTGTGTIDLGASPSITTSLTSPYINVTTINTGYELNGASALRFPSSDTTTGGSIAIGASALSGQTSSAAYGNTAIGYQSLDGTMTTAAVQNTAVGFKAGTAVTSGDQDTFVGYEAGYTSTTSQYCSLFGYQSSCGSGGSLGTALGYQATASGVSSVAVGSYSSASGSQGVALGNSAQSTNNFSFALGYNSVSSGGGIAIGPNAQSSGSNAIMIGPSGYAKGSNSITIGPSAGNSSLSGSSVVIIGPSVGSTVLTSGSNDILIGTSATTTTNGASDTYEIAIGGVGLGSNTFEVGLNGTTTAGTLYGNVTVTGNLTANGAAVDTPHVTFSSSVAPGFAVASQASPATVSRTAWTIKSATIIGALNGAACSAVIDIWKVNAGYPTVTNTITASDLPTLSSATNKVDTTLSGWTTSVSVGDVFIFNVQSNTCDNLSVVLSAS